VNKNVVHDQRCPGTSYSALKADLIDKEKREKISRALIGGNPKLLWREVA
jgi:hypothetical protein